MTELKKIKHAKMYMDKLANGINPIDDTAAPEEDMINNVRFGVETRFNPQLRPE